MPARHSIAEARHKLPTLIRKAENGRAVELTRHGEPVAAIIRLRAFERLAISQRNFVEAYRDFTGDANLPTRVRPIPVARLPVASRGVPARP